MSKRLLFWVIMILWLVIGLCQYWPLSGVHGWFYAGNVVLFILLGLLGWKVFGPAIEG